ncbi:serine acetyltransferase [Citrobacter rodentium]|jgi:Serine acetyltransferase|uniref:Serine acetyltransferase n=2 Tax=Citrobacter rodentium TaxID=67825 RepID=D2TSA4_CITRI|nr:serine acetyltransferase [Citrobacter rodentium]KIQ49110.1 transferase [Citrobacter rodentium]QBY28834.1 serine acetyltransferase [Citrobacter rodentium]UHO29303.1 serine acetyltransferase [Citrobacter rodentium NBRC 105723 = DSM 16636]CBG89070.1 conserved hypothetical protein [Citrobacter rodentium ICC168]HAT8013488.1 serine acetyltransferase [Citrobacter rodentium NBRC 105723 = DSM 16636]
MDKNFLKECLRVEVIGGKDKVFSWPRAIRHAWRQPHRRYLFWFRIYSYLYNKHSNLLKKIANSLNRKLIRKYNTDISLNAKIQPGLHIAHYNSIVITSHCSIGKNFKIRQCTTIGIQNQGRRSEEYSINIGDNVYVGAHVCIVADSIRIGNNVIIGAMSFINKDIPDNCTYYTRKEGAISAHSASVIEK